MSDILIKNMEMPDKATTIVVFPEGKARVFRQDIDHDEWLTVVEVPQHGPRFAKKEDALITSAPIAGLT